eukprot:CAMPEP_0168415328 /NCGR_PEP_ID=MMETSP0228-20121227/30178_1 /TAXON_ID=133427 /ORGANISM="Protoceratium reticulatum, Strain CCCM 535 (=CCMP 1889)" /LENGTH=137 /DNA_ID=CAMNT_0008429139 /DNA_START=86 /DNA_END=495 /DNA_ORIENTATION=-
MVAAATAGCMGAAAWQDDDEPAGVGACLRTKGLPCSDRPTASMLGDITNVVESSAVRPAFKVHQQLPLQQQAQGPPVAQAKQKEAPEEPGRAALEAAAGAVLDAALATGMDSQWTSLLASRLAPLARDCELQAVLRL